MCGNGAGTFMILKSTDPTGFSGAEAGAIRAEAAWRPIEGAAIQPTGSTTWDFEWQDHKFSLRSLSTGEQGVMHDEQREHQYD